MTATERAGWVGFAVGFLLAAILITTLNAALTAKCEEDEVLWWVGNNVRECVPFDNVR